MGKVLDEIGKREEEFIAKQKVFFVATSALDREHRVNVSPKAPGSSLVVLGPKKVAYADLCGSGSETAAHVLENERMTLMFCNLEEGAPKILRLHGKAELIVKESINPTLLKRFPDSLTLNAGFRSIFILDVERISASCGYSLPVMTYQKTRKILDEFAEQAGEEGMKDYCIHKNSFSIDGLPSVALVRNKDLAIAPKLESGYISGEKVSKEDSKGSFEIALKLAARRRPRESDLVMHGILLFLAGALFGAGSPHLITIVSNLTTSSQDL